MKNKTEKCYKCKSLRPNIYLVWKEAWLCNSCNKQRLRMEYCEVY